MEWVKLAVGIIVALWVLWVFYVAVMHIRDVRDRWGLTRAQKVLGYPTAWIGVALDVILRPLFSILFLTRVRWETISKLLEREVEHGTGWRKRQAEWWREELLADFDRTGSHGTPGRK